MKRMYDYKSPKSFPDWIMLYETSAAYYLAPTVAYEEIVELFMDAEDLNSGFHAICSC